MRQYLDRIARWFARFMTGRYGPDDLGFFLIIAACIVLVIESFTQISYLSILVDVLLFWEMFRYLSKNIAKRSLENDKYRNLIKPVKHRIKYLGMALKDRNNHYYLCPSCSQIIRIPKGHGKVVVTCPKCRTEFTKKS